MNRYQRKRARYRARAAAWQRRSDAHRIDNILARLALGTPVFGYRTRSAFGPSFGPPTFLLTSFFDGLRKAIEAVAAACRTIRIEPTDEVTLIPPPRLVAGQAAKWGKL